MSIEVKYKIKEVADDFAMPAKDVIEVVGKFFPKPKSSSQNLSEEQLNVVFDYLTQTHQIASLEEVFAVAPAPKAPEKAAEAPKAAAAPAPAAAPAVPKAVAPGSAGNVDLHSVEPKTAAMIMAIVADELGAPINELRFISIREI